MALPDFEGFTFTILTRDAMQPIAELHDRQPVILSPEGYEPWLANEPLQTVEQIAPERLRFHKVGKSVGSVKNEGPELIEPIAV